MTLNKEGYDYGVAGLDPRHQVHPTDSVHGTAAGHVGENQLFPNAVVGQKPQLGFQVPGLIVSFADPVVHDSCAAVVHLVAAIDTRGTRARWNTSAGTERPRI